METLATGGLVDEFEADSSSEEYQLIMAYCAKRKRQRSGFQGEGMQAQHQGHFHEQEYRRASDVPGKKRIRITYGGGRGVVEGGAAMAQHQSGGAVRQSRNLTGVADRLAQITDSVQQTTSNDPEADGLEDQEDIIQKLVELLKNSGDQLNEEIKRNKALQKHLKTSFTYALFERVASTFQEGLGGPAPAGPPGSEEGGLQPGSEEEGLSEEELQRQRIALAFEVTSRLSAVDLVPMSRAMGYGARYVQLHHSSWVKQRGGWGKTFAYEDVD